MSKETVILNVPKLLYKKGEFITCENGHLIAEFLCDHAKGHSLNDPKVIRWIQPLPEIGIKLSWIKCRECDGIWIKQIQEEFGCTGMFKMLKQAFHFTDG